MTVDNQTYDEMTQPPNRLATREDFRALPRNLDYNKFKELREHGWVLKDKLPSGKSGPAMVMITDNTIGHYLVGQKEITVHDFITYLEDASKEPSFDINYKNLDAPAAVTFAEILEYTGWLERKANQPYYHLSAVRWVRYSPLSRPKTEKIKIEFFVQKLHRSG